MTDDTNDKILFRQDRFPEEQASTLPSDLMWAVGEPEYITGGVGGGQSTISSIIFAGGGTDSDTWNQQDPPPEVIPDGPAKPRVPTPTITGVTSTEVHQTIEGMSKADVFIGVTGMDGVEYEVMVTPV